MATAQYKTGHVAVQNGSRRSAKRDARRALPAPSWARAPASSRPVVTSHAQCHATAATSLRSVTLLRPQYRVTAVTSIPPRSRPSRGRGHVALCRIKSVSGTRCTDKEAYCI
eukprot:3940963-Rhodomonas_salina.3